MPEYKPQEFEAKWQRYWKENKTFVTEFPSEKPKFYVLDMFPYPSGAGLHVGHPLGYIATDIVARFKRHKGYNVLHPMGYDAFGLPAEQFAIQTGQHPAVTTEKNIETYRRQLDAIGFSYDWEREIRTSDPKYYKWTQWIFLQLFESYFDKHQNRACPIQQLLDIFETQGCKNPLQNYACDEDTPEFTPNEWKSYTDVQKHLVSLKFRLAYLSETMVNWCPGLGTVLANEEVKDGYSERGGFPVIRKLMPQWSLRITAYADRLLADLDLVDWPESIKEQQRNWIGKSKGCMLFFKMENSEHTLAVFTTRVDTIYGVTYLTLAPEHELIAQITPQSHKKEVEAYINYAKNKSERERQADVKNITGVFTGAYAIHPLNGEKIPVWIGEYVLAGYGTGAVMAVPSSDTRDYAFAKHFDLPIIQVQEGPCTDISKPDFDPKAGTMINSGFLNGLPVDAAIEKMAQYVEQNRLGYAKINYRMRDAIFSRQRYWGEPIPVYYKQGVPYPLPQSMLPLKLPQVDKYLPTEEGEPPLARATNWSVTLNGQTYPLETSTMPGWAGSSWYFLRYMDASNADQFAAKEALDYWKDVDLYVGGSEHATGHLLYSRFWHKFLYDLGLVKTKEYARKLVNQGMIQGRSNFIYKIVSENTYVSFNLKDKYPTTPIHVDVNLVQNDILDIEAFKHQRPDVAEATFITENGNMICGWEIEKMSKSKFNVINPDWVIAQYGADTLRMFEMFLGPLELSKPWNTSSIHGVSRFLRNVWRLFFDDKGNSLVTDEKASDVELRILHKTIKKVTEDIERLSFNTSVSAFMVCINDLAAINCHKRCILSPFLILMSPFAPHISEELWHHLGNPQSITYEPFPECNEKYLAENSYEYPISVNGKLRHKMSFGLDVPPEDIEKQILATQEIIKWTDGKNPKKVIVVPGKIVNIVI